MDMGFKGFDHPYVAVDVLMFSIVGGKLVVLLSKRNKIPFEGRWALPGGFVGINESLDEAADRVMLEKGGISGVYLEQLYSFGETKRDPRGRVISVAYFALVPEEQSEDVIENRAAWFDVNQVPEVAFDHGEIIRAGVARLKAKITYSNIVVGLLPREFRLSELQKVYEIILGKKLDKRNFRKKMLSLDLLKPAGKKDQGEKRRPAMLFTFKTTRQVYFD